jgi:hypothetical protein
MNPMQALLYLAILLPLAAQTPEKNLVLLGAEGNTTTSPKPSAFAAMAVELNASQQIYSWTMYQVVGIPGKTPSIQTTTGVATVVRTLTLGSVIVDIVGIGSVGAATTSTATTSAFNGGGGAMIRNLFKRWPGLLIWLGALQDKAGSSNMTQWMFSLGRTF